MRTASFPMGRFWSRTPAGGRKAQRVWRGHPDLHARGALLAPVRDEPRSGRHDLLDRRPLQRGGVPLQHRDRCGAGTFSVGQVVGGISVLGEITATPKITLTPASATNPTGTNHTLTATATDGGAPAVGVTVTFKVLFRPMPATRERGSPTAAGSRRSRTRVLRWGPTRSRRRLSPSPARP